MMGLAAKSRPRSDPLVSLPLVSTGMAHLTRQKTAAKPYSVNRIARGLQPSSRRVVMEKGDS